jgi:acyl-CoA synthetase (AMP-forming)/AMP-acid ligase II
MKIPTLEIAGCRFLFPPYPCHTSKEDRSMNVSHMISPHVAETPHKTRMAPYKVPVAVEFIEEIPRLASGKALRRMLREKQ